MATPTKKRRSEDSPENPLSATEIRVLADAGYRILRKISQGVSAKIYLCNAQYPSGEMQVACKVIDKIKGQHRFINKFLPRELDILQHISNRHCIQVNGLIDLPSKVFVFMRYAENGDLLDYLSEHGPTLDEKHARMWMRQLLLALKYLHSLCIAHRDIKCENILITSNFNAKLADFGFSRYWVDEGGAEVTSDTYCGSISYAAPEILAGIPYCPKFCDVWSLGVVFFIMFNMTKPFSKKKTGAILRQQLEKDYRFKPKVEESLSQGAKDLIGAMLEPDLALRPTAEALLQSEWMLEDKLLLRLVPDEE